MKKISSAILIVLLAGGLHAQELRYDCSVNRIERYKNYAQEMNTTKSAVGENYNIVWHQCYWDIDPAVKYISGHVTTLFISRIPSLSSVDFELHNSLTADSVVYHGSSQTFTHTNNVLSIPLTSALALNALDSVSIYYHGTPVASGGFGAFEQTNQGGFPVIWTLSEPYGAKYWWPSKNDLSDKIDSIDIFIRTPLGNRAGSNGALVSVNQEGNHLLHHWKHRHPIATYLVAIAVSNYALYEQQITLPGGTLPVVNYIYPADTAAAIVSLNNLVPVYSFFDSLFMPYPFMNEKYGHAQFSWGGGMEHQTMTFMGGWNWDILVHEFAHQWFGDYITCASWHDIWLNEGFATYLTGLAYERLAPNYWMGWKLSTINHVTSQPGGSVYVDDTTSVNRVFDGRLSYSKAATVLHMLRHVMGNDAFFLGISSYLNDPFLAYRYAKTEDLKTHLQAACNCSLSDFFDAWVYGQGYPSYTIHLEKHPGNLYRAEVSQGTSHTSVPFFRLPLPLRFYGNGTDTTFILDNQSNAQSFWLDPGFVVDSVRFDPDMWLITKNNVLTTGISDRANEQVFSLYPNPATQTLYISAPRHRSFHWKVLSPSGRLLLTGSGQELSADISALAPGLYLFVLEHSTGTSTQKFVKACD